MIFLSKKHEKRFYEACCLIDTGYEISMAACYLLTVKKSLWEAMKDAVYDDEIAFDKINFIPRTVEEQALYNEGVCTGSGEDGG